MSSDEDSSPQPQRTHAAGGPKHDDEDEFEFEQNFTDKKVKTENKQASNNPPSRPDRISAAAFVRSTIAEQASDQDGRR